MMPIKHRFPRLNLFIFCLLLLFYPRIPSCGCDSTILELLTGASAQQSTIKKILSISQKMQKAANLLKSFNHAAANKLHQEVLEEWLAVPSQLAANSSSSIANKDELAPYLKDIAQELGLVRKKLEQNQLGYIHEILETCITRMSLVCALISGRRKVISFLEIELPIYSLRPLFGDICRLKAATESFAILERLNIFQKQISSKSGEMTAKLSNLFKIFADSLEKDTNDVSTTTLTAYQDFLNQFVKFKQNLLNEDYFQNL